MNVPSRPESANMDRPRRYAGSPSPRRASTGSALSGNITHIQTDKTPLPTVPDVPSADSPTAGASLLAPSPSRIRQIFSNKSQLETWTPSPQAPEAPHPVGAPANPRLPNGGLPSKQSLDEQLAARISSLLTRIPAPIRLAAPAELDAPSPPPRSVSSTYARAPPAALDSSPLAPPRAQRSLSNASQPPLPLTLTPAAPARHPSASTLLTSPGTSASTAALGTESSDIKLYHLHQPGRAQPVKLYVRLVRERVMVRVGGGWADLGTYLAEYASHHGRRGAAGTGPPAAAFAPSPVAPPPPPKDDPPAYTATGAARRPTTPPPPPNGVRETGSSPPAPSSSGGLFGLRKLRRAVTRPKTPDPKAAAAARAAGPDDSPRGTVAPHAAAAATTDDGAEGSPAPPVPLGLAGPTGRALPMSPGKRAWVNGVLSQARAVSGGGGAGGSAEKKRAASGVGGGGGGGGGGGELGELGTVGGTRRVFLKGEGGGLGG